MPLNVYGASGERNLRTKRVIIYVNTLLAEIQTFGSNRASSVHFLGLFKP